MADPLTNDVGPVPVAGAVAVVTGGASGIGRVVVEALLDQGATVYVADVEQAALEAAVSELADRGPVVGALLWPLLSVLLQWSQRPARSPAQL